MHDAGDCLVLGTAWYLQRVAMKGRDAHYSYGYGRYSMLGGWLTSVVLIIGAVAMLAVMGLLPWTAKITADKMEFQGRDITRLPAHVEGHVYAFPTLAAGLDAMRGIVQAEGRGPVSYADFLRGARLDATDVRW